MRSSPRNGDRRVAAAGRIDAPGIADAYRCLLASAFVIAQTESSLVPREPFAVELANTLYARKDDPIDFLASSEQIVAWLGRVPITESVSVPTHLGNSQIQMVRSLRDAVRDVLVATAEGAVPPVRAVDDLNRAASLVKCQVGLRWPVDGGPVAETTPLGHGFAAGLVVMAIECISFLASPSLALVRRCDGPDCPMLFVQRHHKRRFCHERCAHRARQARYYRNRQVRASNTGSSL
jgi:predicted RNA-binding Zn ribbon-like protein